MTKHWMMAGYRLSMDTVDPPSVWVSLDVDKKLLISMVSTFVHVYLFYFFRTSPCSEDDKHFNMDGAFILESEEILRRHKSENYPIIISILWIL
jgi:hypothetical protein